VIPRILRQPRTAATWFALEIVAILGFWLTLYVAPHFRPAFLTGGASELHLVGFATGDTAILAASAVALVGAARRAEWAWLAMLLAVAASAYPAIYWLALALTNGGGEISATLMLPLVVGNLVFAIANRAPARVSGRESAAAPAWWNLLKAAGELAILWTAFLWLLPSLINRVDALTGWDIPATAVTTRIGLGVMALGTVLLVWSVVVMTVRGGGTPFPFDAPRKLVLEGPYRFVRNPQVIGGMIQGMALLLLEPSVLLVAYLAVGAATWHLVLRPWEEAGLVTRFGASYEAYQRHVPCWIPRLTPYAAPEARASRQSDPSG
jgi:protein-S-isoprenylcysteine O-methyltransferase Ste14